MPNTVNIGLNIANTGDFPGAWATTVTNPDFQVIDGILGGNQTISLTGSSATTLSIATGVIGTGSLTPGAGPTQSGNAIIQFSGTLASNCVVTFPRPGYWIVKNGCTVGSFYVQARATGTGNLIGLPPGEAIEVFCDGTNMDFVGLGRVGSYMDLAVSTTPAWMTACTVLPYLPCLGTATYSASVYPALSTQLGSTFGGNGVTTFGVPDLGNRYRIPLDTSGAGRVTSAGCGIDGTVFGAAGGSQSLPSHTHTASNSVTDPGHIHNMHANGTLARGGSDICPDATLITTNMFTESATTNISVSTNIASTGAGSSGNIPPSLVAGITFIRAG